MPELDLPNGYYELPRGKMANVVTCLEMQAKPQRELQRLKPPCFLRTVDPSDLAAYRALFRKVGEDWMWFSRIIMPDDKLHATLAHGHVMSFALSDGSEDIGVLELDFREDGQCELAFFGLARSAMGKGLGRALLDEGIAMAWDKPIRRMWVHTCTFDSPDALPFYVRSGFTPYARMIEIHDDPRLTGKLPLHASKQIPVIT